MRGSGLERALVQVYDENNCVIGWAVQVVGDVGGGGLDCVECGEEGLASVQSLIVVGDIYAGGDITVDDITAAGELIGDELYVHYDSGFGAYTMIVNAASFDVRVPSPRFNFTNGAGTGELGGHTFVNRDGIVASLVELIPAGRVTQYIRCDAIMTNGTTRGYLGFALNQGGVVTQNIATGGDTWQVELHASGRVTVARTAGTGTGTIVFRAMWI